MKLLHSTPHQYHLQKWAKAHAWHYTHGVDLSYAFHAALERVFGDKKPKSFRYHPERGLFAYIDISEEDLLTVIALGDIEAIHALGLSSSNNGQGYSLRELPKTWAVGQQLIFETECLPTQRINNNKELGVIAAGLANRASADEFVDAGELLRNWFSNQISGVDDRAWEGAVAINRVQVLSKSTVSIMRKGPLDAKGERERRWLKLDKVIYRGELQILDVPKFEILLARGIGRNRSFGSGMLMLSQKR